MAAGATGRRRYGRPAKRPAGATRQHGNTATRQHGNTATRPPASRPKPHTLTREGFAMSPATSPLERLQAFLGSRAQAAAGAALPSTVPQSTATTTPPAPAPSDAIARLRAALSARTAAVTSPPTPGPIVDASAAATFIPGPPPTPGPDTTRDASAASVSALLAKLSAPPPARCSSHLDPTRWVVVPTARRPGWLRGQCNRCGVFLGFIPADPAARSGKRPKPC